MDQFAMALQTLLSHTAHLESTTVAAPVQPVLQAIPAAATVSVQAPASSITSIRGLFIDAAFVSKHLIPLQLRDTPLVMEAFDGRPLQPAHVTHETVPLSMAVGALHHEIIRFQVISSPKFPVVIGYPWL
ncbi:hypothetical protein AB205_0089750 [Aquarana catesbeiana]|uniref:Uncharacterized protein n=2 Tax=Aquarana catesbeiana TaxID=8400 RepID=A0A2G9QE60_AQUCT|nr:hypothetical protein AB205_0089750 [Aquarana catesbeiana]